MTVTWNFRCACWGIVSSLLVAVLFGHCLSCQAHLALRITEGAVTILLFLSSLIAFHISTLRCSESHTLSSLLLSYWWHQGEWLATPFILAKANRMWKHPREAQEDLIRELTRRHAKTEYGRKNRLGEIRSLGDLRRKHPLTTYDHFKDYIQRLADGEEGVFLGERSLRFGVTSGTTGTGKKVPYSGFFWEGESFAFKLYRLGIYQGISRPSSVQKRCFLYTHPKFSVTKTGLAAASFLFVTENDTSIVIIPEQSSPPPAFTITHEPSAMYVHMLFAIADPNLAMLQAAFNSQLYRALTCLETNWRAMLEDLSTGKINTKIPLDPDVRRSLQGYLRPDQARVCQLRREFEKGFEGIVKRIWPHLQALDGIDISGFKEKLQEKYANGTVCVSAFNYGTTECGSPTVNMWVTEKEPRYVIIPNIVVYEFIPEEECLEKDPTTLLIDEVEVGGRYELVSTTRTGLYRYRSGDVVQVTGFHERCPVIRMLYRIGEYLNLVYEKMNAQVVDAAIKATVGSWPRVQLVDWTCAESPIYDDSPELYYIVFIEIDEEQTDFTENQLSKFDEYLQHHQYYYKNLRASRTISAPHVHLVAQGAFTDLEDFTISRTTASSNQYKTPRKLKTRELVEWMMERVVN
ncbi:probable indole-3-acetic acid-amido synthetase GH3.9 [Patiria miniata]|uniref:GH3 domain-containing protein n=1 Tax=Patiria miniata TaxID=46514 RepID=A0A913ZF27_PATMI|nr:probable indole-3-acetic acid-amido synthetase GH3.9 [Patiria miniata]